MNLCCFFFFLLFFFLVISGRTEVTQFAQIYLMLGVKIGDNYLGTQHETFNFGDCHIQYQVSKRHIYLIKVKKIEILLHII